MTKNRLMDNSSKIVSIVNHFGIRQKDFAAKMGVSAQTVNNWCKRGVQSLDIIYDIVDKFPSFNPSFLFDDNAPIEKDPISGGIIGNGSGMNVGDNEKEVIDRFLSIIEEKDRQIAQPIDKL